MTAIEAGALYEARKAALLEAIDWSRREMACDLILDLVEELVAAELIEQAAKAAAAGVR